MQNTTIIRSAAVLLALFVTVDAAQAWTKDFPGTRGQVRASCTGEGRELIEGGDHSICLNQNNGTGVVCYDNGKCSGTGPRTIGAWGIRTRDYQPPQSLVASGSSSGPSAAPTDPAPSAPPASTDAPVIY